ncbi:GNAT family N-acetyltransferase [Calidifontibacter indicus]|uniref:Ribosomal protein S18 acetylase RimI-like enzyme n=1 Tax=Calidifontibacter indicus TaxID=419650 RepID=A0A3D9UKU0_9MICO|nr:GNAT family N-acetyltransferase [Calidifontibacter indicus]REF30078.1 ribosomal protein S18 acetylase RimI-like enzyme [Calidifontibacter indicus]
MSEITIRTLGTDEWETYREVRLNALEESPEAFAASATQEKNYDEDFWRARVERSRRLVAEDGESIVGVVSVGDRSTEENRVGELFGLWVTPRLRGQGVAWKLVQAGVDQAQQEAYKFLIYWVGTDNGRAVAFASSFGFRPTDSRRPMKGASEETQDEDEMAMVYPLGDDPAAVPSSVLDQRHS